MSQCGPQCFRSLSTGIRVLLAGLTGALLAGFAGWISAGPPPESPKVSEYASAPALMSQVEYYMSSTTRLKRSLADETKYRDSAKTKVAKDGATLGALFMALGLHDQDSAVKASAPRLVELAEELVAASDDYSKAKAAFEALKKGIADGAEGGKPLVWESRCDLVLLMKQVTTVHGILNRTIKTESRLAKRKDDAAGKAALLAMIGQVTLIDTHAAMDAVKNVEEDESKVEEKLAAWYRYSAMMRDSAGGIEKGIAENDFETISKQKESLQKSCDDCHEVFNIEEQTN